jgi:putative flippase GtrA
MIISNAKERNRFLKFAVVGSIGAVIDFGLFNICTSVFSIIPVVSSVISFITAVTSNFLWNRFWTYPDSRSKTVSRQLVQFLVISLIGLGIRTPLFAYLEGVMTRFFASYALPLHLTPVFLGHNISLAIVIVIVMFWNFFANRFWTYSDVKNN